MITRILTSEWRDSRLARVERLLGLVDAMALRLSGSGYSMSVSGRDT
jgi:hypothetical protein